jgi:adenylosuccinate lyase
VLNLVVDVVSGMVVNPAVIAANMADELAFMATENVIMAGVKAGASRQELHERVRTHSHAAAARMKAEGASNDLLARMRADPLLAPHVPADPIDPMRYVGRAPEQVDEYLAEVLGPLLDAHAHRRGRFTASVSV